MESRRLAALSSGGLPAKPGEVEQLVEVITDASNPLYTRGLASASLAACLRDRPAPGILQDLALMDGLIEVIGQTKGSNPGFRCDAHCHCVLA